MTTTDRQLVTCALCGPGAPTRQRYPERLAGPIDFAARKTPTRQHFQVVECLGCGLVYSDPILPPEAIYQLYRESPFISEAQLDNMGHDYREQLLRLLPLLPRRPRLLEIGCSSGFVLRTALDLGFADVRGVEPGEDAVRHAEPAVRERIVNATFHAGLFEPESFDVVCAFQVLDHLLDPVAVLRDAHRLLRPGGLLLLLNHNIRAWLPRLLGERCPMYDVEHIYLFDPRTVARLLDKTGFEVVSAGNVANSYTLSYALKMFPLPGFLKGGLRWLAESIGVSGWRVRLPAGNMVAVGRKAPVPAELRPAAAEHNPEYAPAALTV